MDPLKMSIQAFLDINKKQRSNLICLDLPLYFNLKFKSLWESCGM